MSLLKRYWLPLLIVFVCILSHEYKLLVILAVVYGLIYLYMKKTGRRYLIPRRRPKIKVTEHMGFADDEAPEETDFDDESYMYTLGYNDGLAGRAMDVINDIDTNYIMGYQDGEGSR